jgi:hypothetical protein
VVSSAVVSSAALPSPSSGSSKMDRPGRSLIGSFLLLLTASVIVMLAFVRVGPRVRLSLPDRTP